MQPLKQASGNAATKLTRRHVRTGNLHRNDMILLTQSHGKLFVAAPCLGEKNGRKSKVGAESLSKHTYTMNIALTDESKAKERKVETLIDCPN